MICSSERPAVRGAFECDDVDPPASNDPAAVARSLRTKLRAERPTLREIQLER